MALSLWIYSRIRNFQHKFKLKGKLNWTKLKRRKQHTTRNWRLEEIEEETKAFENLKEVLEIKVEKKNSNETNARLFVAANIEKGAVFFKVKKSGE